MPEMPTTNGEDEDIDRRQKEPRELSAEEKLGIVERSPQVVHMTEVQSIESVLDMGILSNELAQRSGVELPGSNPYIQTEAGRLDLISVFDSSNLDKLAVYNGGSVGTYWRDPVHAWPAKYKDGIGKGFFQSGWRVALFIDPKIERIPGQEIDIGAQTNESFVERRIKPEKIMAIGVLERLANQRYDQFSEMIFSSVPEMAKMACRLAKSPFLEETIKSDLLNLGTAEYKEWNDAWKFQEKYLNKDGLTPEYMNFLQQYSPEYYQLRLDSNNLNTEMDNCFAEYNKAKSEGRNDDAAELWNQWLSLKSESDEINYKMAKGKYRDIHLAAREKFLEDDPDFKKREIIRQKFLDIVPGALLNHLEAKTGKNPDDITLIEYLRDIAQGSDLNVITY